MTAIADLQAAEASIATAIQAAISLIQSLQSGTTNADDPQVEAVVAQLKALTTNLTAAVTPAAPAPAPAA